MEASEVSHNSSSSEQFQIIQSKVEQNEAPQTKDEEIIDRQNCSNYECLNFLGGGTYGDVFSVRYIPNKTIYAMKVFKCRTDMEVIFNKEVDALQRVQGVNQCVQLFSVLDPFEDGKRALAMEFCRGGQLLQSILDNKGLDILLVTYYLHQLVQMLENLQSRRLAHLDIKADNIFLDQEFNLVLGDFGMCEEIPNGTVNITNYQKGSQCYQLPELQYQVPYDPFQADIFAAGVTVFTMYSCLQPFQNSELYSKLFFNPKAFWSEMRIQSPNTTFKDNLNQDFINLFTGMVHTDRDKRITLNQIKEHPFYIGIPNTVPSLCKTISQNNCKHNNYINPESPETQTNQQLTRNHGSISISDQFENYEGRVSNLLTKRQAEIYNQEAGRLVDFWTNIDCKTLFMYLFIQSQDFTSNTPELCDSTYRFDCIYKPKQDEGASNVENIKYSISLQTTLDNSRTYVLFAKKSGDSFEYFKLVSIIKNIVKKFKWFVNI